MKPNPWILPGIVAALFVVLYVLSAGPAYRVAIQGVVKQAALEGKPEEWIDETEARERLAIAFRPSVEFYWPLIWMSQQADSLGRALRWYLGLWDPGRQSL